MSVLWLVVAAGLWTALYLLVRAWSAATPGQTVDSPDPVRRPWLPVTLARPPSPFLAELVAAGGLLALITVGFFWQILLTPSAWMPAGGGDLAPFLYPNYHFAAEQVRQGSIPLWNPHLYSGAPFAADIQSGLFYPVNLLVFLLVPTLTYEWLEYLAIFHFWLAGLTMYLCLRLFLPPGARSAGSKTATPPGLTPLAAFAGAVAFEFSDLFIVHFGNLNMIAVAAWLPLAFLLFQRSLTQDSTGLAAVGGGVLAIATLAGHIQITLFILLTLGLYTIWQAVSAYQLSQTEAANSESSSPPGSSSPTHNPAIKRLRLSRQAVRPFFLLMVTLLITVGLSALLLLPAYQMSQHTPRAELPYPEAARYSLHPVQMVGLLIPGYFGRDPALHWGPWERVETGYIGLLTLMLALLGAILYPGRLKQFFIGLGLLALLLAMGGYALVHGWLYAAVPGFDQLRAPARFILLLDFSLAALAACGLNQLLPRSLDARTRRLLPKLLKGLTWSLGGLIVIAAPLSYYAMLVTQDRNPAIFNRAAAAASGVATFAIFSIAALSVLYLIHNRRLYENRAGMTVIVVLVLDLFTLGANVDVGHTRPVAGFDHPEALAFLESQPGPHRLEVTTDVWHLWQPNTALVYGLYDAWGLYNPLSLADTSLYWSGAPPRSSGRYNFLGIKYIIASKAGAPADGNIVPVFDGDPDINLYLNQDALPRVLFVGRAAVVPTHDAAWEAIRSPDFDPATTVILEGGRTLETDPEASLSIERYQTDSVTVTVNTDQPGYLVLSDAYYPGWRATIDGRLEPIQRANYAFRAVYVPAGRHTVHFFFDPVIWKVGLGISGLTLLVLAIWAGRNYLFS